MTLPLAFDILLSGVRLSLICAVIGLGCAFLLIAVILRSSPGNERMRQISGAVQEGAKAYLNRQVMTISVIPVTILFFSWGVLLAGGGLYWDAHRSAGQRACDPGSGEPDPHRCASGGI